MEEIVKKIISLFLILLAIIGVATTPLSGYPTAKAENEAATTEETAEKENASPDACADISGEMLAGVAAFGLEGEKYAIMREIAFHIGRWIYLADAVCDYPDDVKRGRFNPFAAEYTAEEMKKFAEEEAYELTVPDLAAAQNAFALADCRDAHINACIENILHYGMKNSFYITMRKEWHDERSL